jgi:hypothetical protein
MEINVRLIQIIELWMGYGITSLVFAYYSITAPWYKYPEGRYIWGLLCSIWLVLTNSMVRIIFPGVQWTSIAGMILFGVFIIAMASVGWGIWCAQHGRKCIERKKRRVSDG